MTELISMDIPVKDVMIGDIIGGTDMAVLKIRTRVEDRITYLENRSNHMIFGSDSIIRIYRWAKPE